MSLRSALLAATVAVLPIAAQAQPINGLYVGIGAGLNVMQQENGSIAAIGTSGSQQMSPGAAVVASMGWGFGNGLRAELEGDFRYNSVKSVSGYGSAFTSASGKENKYGVMVNALYDFDLGGVMPYVGAGVGYQQEAVSGITYTTSTGATTGGSGSKGSFAYQGIVGAALPFSTVPGLALTADYRFMGLTGTRSYNATAGGAATTLNSTSNYNHTILVGLRYAFGAPAMVAPAAATPPAAAPTRSYLVFFHWDKSNLTDRAKGIIKDAADTSKKVAHTKIDVSGNADTSSKAQYNQGLSMRRAQAVAAELVRLGVPKNEIAITANGDTKLLVPTGPGVREPQNRRVEIVIR